MTAPSTSATITQGPALPPWRLYIDGADDVAQITLKLALMYWHGQLQVKLLMTFDCTDSELQVLQGVLRRDSAAPRDWSAEESDLIMGKLNAQVEKLKHDDEFNLRIFLTTMIATSRGIPPNPSLTGRCCELLRQKTKLKPGEKPEEAGREMVLRAVGGDTDMLEAMLLDCLADPDWIMGDDFVEKMQQTAKEIRESNKVSMDLTEAESPTEVNPVLAALVVMVFALLFVYFVGQK